MDKVCLLAVLGFMSLLLSCGEGGGRESSVNPVLSPLGPALSELDSYELAPSGDTVIEYRGRVVITIPENTIEGSDTVLIGEYGIAPEGFSGSVHDSLYFEVVRRELPVTINGSYKLSFSVNKSSIKKLDLISGFLHKYNIQEEITNRLEIDRGSGVSIEALGSIYRISLEMSYQIVGVGVVEKANEDDLPEGYLPAPPANPSGFSVSGVMANSANLTWPPVASAQSYVVALKQGAPPLDCEGENAATIDTEDTSLLLTELSAATAYGVRVCSVGVGGLSSGRYRSFTTDPTNDGFHLVWSAHRDPDAIGGQEERVYYYLRNVGNGWSQEIFASVDVSEAADLASFSLELDEDSSPTIIYGRFSESSSDLRYSQRVDGVWEDGSLLLGSEALRYAMGPVSLSFDSDNAPLMMLRAANNHDEFSVVDVVMGEEGALAGSNTNIGDDGFLPEATAAVYSGQSLGFDVSDNAYFVYLDRRDNRYYLEYRDNVGTWQAPIHLEEFGEECLGSAELPPQIAITHDGSDGVMHTVTLCNDSGSWDLRYLTYSIGSPLNFHQRLSSGLVHHFSFAIDGDGQIHLVVVNAAQDELAQDELSYYVIDAGVWSLVGTVEDSNINASALSADEDDNIELFYTKLIGVSPKRYRLLQVSVEGSDLTEAQTIMTSDAIDPDYPSQIQLRHSLVPQRSLH